MPVTVLVGAQWGDEGKGKLVDRLCEDAQLVVRYQGGNNAGHTIVLDGVRHALHIVPSGALRPDVICALGNGVVINPQVLAAEVEGLVTAGVSLDGRFVVSPAAHLVMPYHVALDGAREQAADGDGIGTTRRGIGPCYSDKAARLGIRIEHLFDRDALRRRIAAVLPEKNARLEELGSSERFDVDAVLEEVLPYAAFFEPMVADVGELVAATAAAGGRVLLEGAQGTLLDIDHGTYPYVTSSSPVAGGACAGIGIGPTLIDEVIGVAKAYATRVGEGPFPSELNEADGEYLRVRGGEVGTTTGRPRRCGWIDLVALRHACRLNGCTGLALTKLDVLSGLEEVRACVAYRLADGSTVDRMPPLQSQFAAAEPVWQTFPGWSEDLAAIRSETDLPPAAREFVRFIHESVGVPIVAIGVGQDRDALVAAG